MPFIIDARNMGGGSIGSAAGGDTSTGTRNNVTLAAPWDESKEYLKGDLATNNGDLYQAQKSVPAGVQISDEDYWALVVAGDKSKETEQLRKDIGSLAELETESKDNLVDAINEVNSIQPDWNQNDETKKDYIKNRPLYSESLICVEISGTPFKLYKVSDKVPTGGIPSLYDSCSVYIKGQYGKSEIEYVGDNIYITSEVMVCVALDDNVQTDVDGSTIYLPEKGTYFLSVGDRPVTGFALGANAEPEITWDGNAETIKTLDAKYIPEMGIITLLSSTADSTKKFKITVDDTGTIKATEVTI